MERLSNGIARKCKKYNVPVLVISGSLGEEINQLYSMGVSGMEASVCNIISLIKPWTMQRNIYAMQQREYFVYLKQEWS